MTNDQIRIEIAKLMGWAKCACGDPNCGAWFAPGAGENDPSLGVPNYPTSLDACREFELSLSTLKEHADYRDALMRSVGLNPHYWDWQTAHEFYRIITATPLQRCEAFLRLHGKWVES